MSEAHIAVTPVTGTESALSEQNGAEAAPSLTPEEWAAHVARVKAAKGKFAHVFSSSEERSQRKQQEIEIEEEGSKRRMRKLAG